MPTPSLVCEFTYTFEEYRRSLDGHRLASLYRNWWVSFFLLAVFLFSGLWKTTRLIAERGWTESFANNGGYLLREWSPFLGFSVVVIVLLFQGGWLYRRAATKYLYFNKSMVYTFGEDGFLFESPSIRSTIGWDKITRIRETHDGFVAFLGSYRSYIWWPADGFPSRHELDEFRQLIRRKIADVRGA